MTTPSTSTPGAPAGSDRAAREPGLSLAELADELSDASSRLDLLDAGDDEPPPCAPPRSGGPRTPACSATRCGATWTDAEILYSCAQRDADQVGRSHALRRLGTVNDRLGR